MKVCVIGGGPSGILASISIKKYHPDFQVILLEKEENIGSRIKISGNGRCNFFNKNINSSHYSNDFVINFLNEKETLFDLLKEVGFCYYYDLEGRAYPISESSLTFLEALKSLLKKYQVEVRTSYFVKKIEKNNNLYIINDLEKFDRLVLSIGGISYLNDQNNYFNICENLNLKLTKLTPSLAPIYVSSFPLSLENRRVKCQVSLLYKNKVMKKEKGEVLFKKNALSGIVIFNMACVLSRLHLNNYEGYQISLDLLPDFDIDKVKELIKIDPSLKHIFILQLSNYLNTFNNIAQTIKDLRFDVKSLFDFKFSQVTSGGVSLKSITPSLNLKNDSNLYLSGEMIDIDGDCGGFNIGMCMLEGIFIGKNIK